MTLRAMFDSIEPDQLPSGAGYAYAGYTSGRWPDYGAIKARFPHASVLSIAVNAAHDADCLDIETGDATPAQAPGWYGRQRKRGITRPCLYASASVMQAGIVPLVRAGTIPRTAVRLWSAHYTKVAHICGPRSCGQVSIDMDGTQWTDRALGRNLDQSLLLPGFFGASSGPGPEPVPPAKQATAQSGPRLWVTAGQSSLHDLAAGQKTTASTILRLTAEHSPGAVYDPDMASYLNGVFAGQADPRHPMPRGLKLWLPG